MATNVIESLPTRMIFENQRAKLTELVLKPGEKTPMHSHGGDYVVYSLTDNRMRITREDGQAHEFEEKAGHAFFRRAETHVTENIGDTESRMLVFEFNECGP